MHSYKSKHYSLYNFWYICKLIWYILVYLFISVGWMVYLIVIYPVQVYAFKFQTFPMITDATVSVHACCTYIHMYYYLSYESVFVVSYTCDFLMDRLNCKYAHTCTSYKSCHFFWHFNIYFCALTIAQTWFGDAS